MKKVLLIICVVVICFTRFPFIPVYAATFSEEPKDKLTRIVKGVGEKIGVTWTKKSLQKVVGTLLAVDFGFWTDFATQKDSIPSDTDMNYSDYTLSADDFKTVADGINSTRDNQVGDVVPIWGICTNPVANVPSGVQMIVFKDQNYQGNWFFLEIMSGSMSYTPDSYGKMRIEATSNTTFRLFSQQIKNYTVPDYNGTKYTSMPWTDYITGQGFNLSSYPSLMMYDYTVSMGCDSTTQYTMTAEDVPTYPPVVNNYYYDSHDTYIITTNNNTTFASPTDTVDNEPIPSDDPLYSPNPEPTDKPSGSSWWEWLLKPLIAAVTGLVDAFSTLLNFLFVPADGFFDGKMEGLQTDFTNKIPIISQLGSFFGDISNTTGSQVKPTIDITLPENYGGGTFSVIDFSYYDEWRTWILNFIRFSAWFVFLKRLFNRIPKMIY